MQSLNCQLLAGEWVFISGRLTLLRATPNASVFIRQMLTAFLCSGGSGDTCYLALWASHIVTDVKAWQGPLLAEPNANDFAKVFLLLSLFAMTLHTQNMLFQSVSVQTDRRFYTLIITSAKYFNLEIRHWWNLYYTRMLGQDLLPTKHAALLSHNMLCGVALSSCDSWWPHSRDSCWLEDGENFQMARVWESRRWFLYVVIWVSFSGPVQHSHVFILALKM